MKKNINKKSTKDINEEVKENDNGFFLKGKIYGRGEIKYKNGDTYVGLLKGTRRHGKGTMSFMTPQRNGDRNDIGSYQGNWKRDKRDGYGVMRYANGNVFEGIWKDDKLYKGELTMNNGSSYEGRFYNNNFHGKGCFTMNNGNTLIGEFINGVLKNPGRIEYTDGRVFEGEIIEFEMGRQGKLTYSNGDAYEGLFEDRHRNGVGVFTTYSGGKYEGRWVDDKKDGFGKEYVAETDEYYEGKFNNNKREGEAKLINRKGEVFKGVWKNNKKDARVEISEHMTKEERKRFIKQFLKTKSN